VRIDAELVRALATYVDKTPWGDVAGTLDATDEALRLALLVTRDDFLEWEARFEAAGVDEFMLARQRAPLSAKDRSALLARLIRDVALNYGMGTEIGDHLGHISDEPYNASSPARVLLALIDAANERRRAVARQREAGETKAFAGERDPFELPHDTDDGDEAVLDWRGDIDELRPLTDELTSRPALCDRLFASKHDAFLAGLTLADTDADEGDRTES
jgi:hypothetical protein